MKTSPLILIVALFASGVLLASLAPGSVWFLLPTFLLTGGFAAFTHRKIWLVSTGIVAILLLGVVRLQSASRLASNDLSSMTPSYLTLIGTVASDVEIVNRANSTDPNSAQFVLSVQVAEVSNEAGGEIGQSFRVSDRVLTRLSLRSPVSNLTLPLDKIPSYGDAISLHGRLEAIAGARNPDGFDYREYYGRLGIRALVSVRVPEKMQILEKNGNDANPILSLLYPLRRRLLLAPRNRLPAQDAVVLNGILWGEKALLTGRLQDAFAQTGTIHILATAGLHVGMLALLLLRFFRFCRLPSRSIPLVTMSVLLCYSALSGGRPSVSRAVLVACFYLFGKWMEREPKVLNALAFAALTLLLFEPRNLFDSGFQLSFATTITIALLMPIMKSALYRHFSLLYKQDAPDELNLKAVFIKILSHAVDLAILSVLAQLGSAPLIAMRMHYVTLVSVIANLAVVPAVFLVLAIGFPAVIISTAFPSMPNPLFEILHPILMLIVNSVLLFSKTPMSVYSVGVVPPAIVVCFYALLWGTAWNFQKKAVKSV